MEEHGSAVFRDMAPPFGAARIPGAPGQYRAIRASPGSTQGRRRPRLRVHLARSGCDLVRHRRTGSRPGSWRRTEQKALATATYAPLAQLGSRCETETSNSSRGAAKLIARPGLDAERLHVAWCAG